MMIDESNLSETQKGLLLAAEKLLATQGFEATTLKQINRLAGQSNSSAIHYHFGSRDAILNATLALRITPNNILREKLIKDARAAAQDTPLSTQNIAELLLLKDRTLNEIKDSKHITYHHRLSLRLRQEVRLWRHLRTEQFAWSLSDLKSELQRAKPFIPPQIIRSRFRNVMNFGMMSLAEIEAEKELLGSKFKASEAIFRFHETVTAIVAILDAPVSPEVVAALHNSMNSSPT